ncbi:MAG: T9SS type A sorting domain-containing protein [Bacteroidales bacterium]|jgi:hypothetical protein|nr:T9SS type A sorting domain-containing protein [Bacteroidales bacterium]
MKKVFLTLVLTIAAFAGKAQYPSFDTFYVYHPQELNNCPAGGIHVDFHDLYIRYMRCEPYNIDYKPGQYWLPPVQGLVTGYNTYGITRYAQHWHFDSTVYVCGIAMKEIGNDFSIYAGYRAYIMDSNFDTLRSTPIYGSNMYQQEATIDPLGYNMYFFGTAIPVQDFYLAGDVGSYQIIGGTSSIYYRHAGGTYDSCIDAWKLNHWETPYSQAMPNCYFDDSPYFMKDEQWVRFADDSIYELYQHTFIELLPVIMVLSDTIIITPPPEDSCRCENCGCDTCPPCCDTCEGVLQQIDLDNRCKIYPNPAKNELFIQSDFKVITLEIYNNLGVKVKEKELNRHEAKIDITNLPSGNYTLKLLTTQGEVKKKFVIK